MTVAELGQRMGAYEFTEWRIWYALEPRGDERADWLAGWGAMWQALIASGKKGRKKLTWADFVPFREKPAPKPSAASVEVSAKIRAFFSKFKRAE